MKKAFFIPFENKKDDQIRSDMSLSPQERVDRMFDLVDSLIYLQKDYILPHKENYITLKKRGKLPQGS